MNDSEDRNHDMLLSKKISNTDVLCYKNIGNEKCCFITMTGYESMCTAFARSNVFYSIA